MMLYPSLSSLLNQINSRYLLVNVVAHRAREIAEEAEANGVPLDKKPVSYAIEEVAEGKIHANFNEKI
jgi:DNA-directed RNA polymerase subunit omega